MSAGARTYSGFGAHSAGSPGTKPTGRHFRQDDASLGTAPLSRNGSVAKTNGHVMPVGAIPLSKKNPQVVSNVSVAAKSFSSRPTAGQLRTELAHERRVRRAIAVTRSTVYALVVVAAVAVLAATLFMPVFRIYGSSMNPTFTEGDFVVAAKGAELEKGDPVVFYYENKILVKRFVASAGQWVDIDDSGNVYVDGERLDEPYVQELAKGECDIELPYQVPDGRIFVLGDNRATSVDSRSTSVGCVSEEQLVGKIVFRVWPLSGFGTVN